MTSSPSMAAKFTSLLLPLLLMTITIASAYTNHTVSDSRELLGCSGPNRSGWPALGVSELQGFMMDLREEGFAKEGLRGGGDIGQVREEIGGEIGVVGGEEDSMTWLREVSLMDKSPWLLAAARRDGDRPDAEWLLATMDFGEGRIRVWRAMECQMIE